jgi:hypothetical protein
MSAGDGRRGADRRRPATWKVTGGPVLAAEPCQLKDDEQQNQHADDDS